MLLQLMHGVRVSAVCGEMDKNTNDMLCLVVQPKDTLPWGKGCAAGHHKRLKPAILVTGIQQVCDVAGLSRLLVLADNVQACYDN